MESFDGMLASKNSKGEMNGFPRLRRLWLDSNLITTLNLEGLQRLEELYLNNNEVCYYLFVLNIF